MSDTDISIEAATTAFVVIDLQKGVTGRELAPYSAADVVSRCAQLADRFRKAGATIVLVRVSFEPDGGDRLNVPVDSAMTMGTPPPGWDEIVPEMGPKDGDLIITKRQWGAFYGTDLDLQLRRRGIKTIVMGGIATNMGVESTARDAYEHGYAQILIEDAMSSLAAEAHEFAITTIFPRFARVRTTQQVLAMPLS